MPINPLQPYQIVVIVIAVFMMIQGFRNYIHGKRGQTLLKLLVRITIWGGMALVVAFPKVSNDLARFIGIQGNINAVILTGFLFVFLIIFKLLSAIERLEQQVSLFVRHDALKSLFQDTKE